MKIEIGEYYDRIRNDNVKCLIIDGKPHTWGVLESSLRKAKDAWTADPTVEKAIMMDIQCHFLNSLTKTIGHKITIRELNEAIEKGVL